MFNIISDLIFNSKKKSEFLSFIYSIYIKKSNQMNSAQVSNIFYILN